MSEDRDLAWFKQELLAEYEDLSRLAMVSEEGVGTVELDQSKVGRLSRMDALQQQAMQVEQKRRRTQRLMDIKAALQRIETDDFGWCVECGEVIPEARLKVNPAAIHCTHCAESH